MNYIVLGPKIGNEGCTTKTNKNWSENRQLHTGYHMGLD